MNDQSIPQAPIPTPMKEELAKLKAMAVGDSYVEDLDHNDACRLHGKARRNGMAISVRREPRGLPGMRVTRVE